MEPVGSLEPVLLVLSRKRRARAAEGCSRWRNQHDCMCPDLAPLSACQTLNACLQKVCHGGGAEGGNWHL